MIKQIVVPKSLRKEIIVSMHDHVTGGHLGTPRTTERIRARFYWPDYRRDIAIHCSICDKCNARKPPSKGERASMQTYVTGAIWERCAMDILGPCPTSSNGMKYILVVGDYFSKFTEAFALPDQESKTVAKVFVNEFVSRYGVPRILHTDQGRNFESRLFKDICELLGIQKTRTCALNPKSDGMIERFNRVVLGMLSKYVQFNQKNWPDILPLLMLAYRSSVHDSTKFTPNFLMFGRELQLPADIMYGVSHIQNSPKPVTEYVQELQEDAEHVFDLVRRNLKKASVSQKKQYDVHSKDKHKFAVDDVVWFYDPTKKKGLSPKLMTKWKGPVKITKKVTDVVRTVVLDSKGTTRTVHVDRLKPYTGENVPRWLRK
jgi:transposase InsO family protein